MDIQETGKKEAIDNSQLNEILNKFDSESDDVFFRPLTMGLGFHHEKDEITKTALRKSIQNKDFESSISHHPKFDSKVQSPSLPKVVTHGLSTTHEVNRADLGPFYNSHKMAEDFARANLLSEKIINDELMPDYQKAPAISQFFAWLVDVLLILAVTIVSAITFSYFNEIPLSSIDDIYDNPGLVLLFVAPVFVFYYLFYFSFLDKTKISTLGKSFFKLRVVGISNKEISLIQSTIRASISLISLVTLGLPMVMDFQGKLSESKVVRK